MKLLSKVNTSSYIHVEGKKIVIPVNGELGYYGIHLSEPWMTELLKLMKPVFNGHFVDVGVNMGQTLIKTQALFDQFEYIGFEPNPVCVNYAQDLIKQNAFKNCNLVPVGISNKESVLKLHFFNAEETDPSASIVENFRPDEKVVHSVFVPVFNLDYIRQFLPNAQNSFLKIDVEGAELEVLSGLRDWLIETQPIIVIEILPVYKAENTQRLNRQNQLENLMKETGYLINRIKKEPKISLELLKEIGIHGSVEDSDYILCPASMQERLETCFR